MPAIARRLFAALEDRGGVLEHRPAVFRTVEWTLSDWDTARANLSETEERMVSALDELDLTTLITSIDGLSPVAATAILAQTGDLTRSAPPEPSPTTRASHRGNASPGPSPAAHESPAPDDHSCESPPGARCGAAFKNNRVHAARYRHLTNREHNRLTPTQAQTAVAAAILRQLYAIVVQQRAWDPVIAAHGTFTWKKPTSTAAA